MFREHAARESALDLPRNADCGGCSRRTQRFAGSPALQTRTEVVVTVLMAVGGQADHRGERLSRRVAEATWRPADHAVQSIVHGAGQHRSQRARTPLTRGDRKLRPGAHRGESPLIHRAGSTHSGPERWRSRGRCSRLERGSVLWSARSSPARNPYRVPRIRTRSDSRP